MSGSASERVAVVTASARNLPALIYSIDATVVTRDPASLRARRQPGQSGDPRFSAAPTEADERRYALLKVFTIALLSRPPGRSLTRAAGSAPAEFTAYPKANPGNLTVASSGAAAWALAARAQQPALP